MLEELKCAYLPFPKGIEMFIYEHTDYRKRNTDRVPRFVTTIEFWKGRLLQRTFGFISYTRKKTLADMRIREVCRDLEGYKKSLLRDVWCNMYGHRVEFDELYQSSDFWINDGQWNFYAYPMYNINQMIEDLSIQYCQYNSPLNHSGMSFFNYICAYRKEPKIELLVKSGLSQYINGLRYLNLKEKSLDKIFKIDRKFVPMLKDLDMSLVLTARRYPWANTKDELIVCRDVRKNRRYIGEYLTRRMYDFLSTRVYDAYLYEDYLKFAERIGMDMKRSSVLFPKNIKKAHDEAERQMIVIASKEQDEKIKQVAEGMSRFIFSDGRYDIFPATCTQDLVDESKALCHCVRQYAERVAEGKTVIFFVRKHDYLDIPLYTLEFRQKKVIQFEGKNHSVPADNAKQFVYLWMKEVVKNPDGYRM